MRSYKIKQARLNRQIPGWTNNNKDIVNVCEHHAEIVDRDRSCCVDQCPIIVSDFSLPAILHRPLPFRLKEGTPHRFLCLGHNLRYIDTLRKPMAASAVSEAINNNSKKDKGRGGDRSRGGTQKGKEPADEQQQQQQPQPQQQQQQQGEDDGEGSEVSIGGDGESTNGDDNNEEEGKNSEESEDGDRRRRKQDPNEDTVDKVLFVVWLYLALFGFSLALVWHLFWL